MKNDGGISTTLINEILETICTLNNISEPEEGIADYEKLHKEYENQVDIITLYIKAICTNILIKTNRRIFVPELKYVVIDLVNDKLNSTDKSIQDLQSIQSMSEAGRSVNFGVSGVLQTKLNLIVQKQLNENETLINRYKLLYKS